jgi:hypothetical protein
MHGIPRSAYTARHTLHPSLQGVNAASTTGEYMQTPTAPYPTREQYVKSESDYIRRMREYEQEEGSGASTPSSSDAQPRPVPVRQPPTMLSALHRLDLTKEAKRQILQKIAPSISTLEKKYKLIFNSDARRSPAHTSPGDFTVDVTSDLLPTRVNGFEIIGYSFPQSEWSIEPYENALPMRYGWNAYPGSRAYGVFCKTTTPAQPVYSGDAVFPFSYSGPTILLSVEQPLVRNPIVGIDVLAASGSLPKRVVLTFARRVGTSIPALIRATERLYGDARAAVQTFVDTLSFRAPAALFALDNVGLQNAVGTYPGRYVLTASSLLEQPQPAYFDGSNFLPSEALFSDPSNLVPSSTISSPELHTLVVVDPVFTAYFVAGQSVGPSASPLGMLFCRPASTARELARRMTVQFQDVITARKAFQSASPLTIPQCPLNQFTLDFTTRDLVPSRVQHANTIKGLRFVAYAAWAFSEESVERAMRNASTWNMDTDTVASLMNPISSTGADLFGERMGLPLQINGFFNVEEPFGTAIESGVPPQMGPEYTVDLTPTPENVDMQSYFNALNTTAASISYQPFNSETLGVDPNFFTIPIILNEDPTDVLPVSYRVNVPSGEYTPWALAAIITQQIRNVPVLRPLAIVVTPSYLPETGNSFAGFRFTSMSSSTFNIAFNLVDVNNQIVGPATMGYRKMLYTGLSMYDPMLLSVNDDPYKGFATPATFPATELGLGIPAPLPTVPLFLPAFSNKRLQITNLEPAPIQANVATTTAPAPALPTAPISITLRRAALFHLMQPVRVDCSVLPQFLVFNAAAGQGEGAGEGVPSEIVFGGAQTGNPLAPAAESFPAGNGGSAGRDDTNLSFTSILDTLSTMHDPTALSSFNKNTLRNVMIRLFGRVALRNGGYGGFVVSPADMSVDGPYRTQMALIPPASLAALSVPPLIVIDGLLTDLATNIKFRSAYVALVNAMLRLINSSFLGGNPLSTAVNNNVTSSSLSLVIAAYRNATRNTAATDFTRDFLTDLVNVALWKSSLTSTPNALITLPGPFGSALVQSTLYYVDTDQDPATLTPPLVTSATPATVDAAFVQTFLVSSTRYAFVLNPGITTSATGPFQVAVQQGSSTQTIAVQDVSVTALGPQATQLFAGKRYTLIYSAPLSPAAVPIPNTQAVDVVVNTVQNSITFTARHNISSLAVSFVAPGPVGTATFVVADTTTTTLAKMYLVANNYKVSFPGFAQVTQEGTTLSPFDIDAALSSLGEPVPPSPEAKMNVLLDSQDPGLANAYTANIIPATSPWNTIPPDLAGAVAGGVNLELDPRTLARELVSIAVLTVDPSLVDPNPNPTSLTVSRINEYAFAMDFVTQTYRRVRSERFGFQADEYTTGTEIYRTTGLPNVVKGTVGSVIDIERANCPYLLLSIDINGPPTPAPLTQGPDGINAAKMSDAYQSLGEGYTDLALNGDVVSIGATFYPQRARQVIQATAYVEVGTDGSTGLRLLDRQDDRAPVVFPTSTYVNWVRFTIFRPDGTLYNFHGKRTMIALRFMSWPDNPNFLTAASAAGNGAGAGDHHDNE